MKEIELFLNMPKDQKLALRNMLLTFIASLIVESFF